MRNLFDHSAVIMSEIKLCCKNYFRVILLYLSISLMQKYSHSQYNEHEWDIYFSDGFPMVVESHDIEEVEVVTNTRYRRWDIPNANVARLQTLLRKPRTKTEPVLGSVLGIAGGSSRDKILLICYYYLFIREK